MKKNKLLTSIVGLSVVGATFASIPNLASCGSKQHEEHHVIEPTDAEKTASSAKAGDKSVIYTLKLDIDTTGDRYQIEVLPQNKVDAELKAEVISIEDRTLQVKVYIANDIPNAGNFTNRFSLKISSEVQGWYQTISGYTFNYKAGHLNNIVLNYSGITLKWKIGRATLKVESHEPEDAKIIRTQYKVNGNVEVDPETGEIWLPESISGGSVTVVCTDSNGYVAEQTCIVNLNNDIEQLTISGDRNIDIDAVDSYGFTATDEYGRIQTQNCTWSIVPGHGDNLATVSASSGLAKLVLTDEGKHKGGEIILQASYLNKGSTVAITQTRKLELASFKKFDESKLSVGRVYPVNKQVSGHLVIPNVYYSEEESTFVVSAIDKFAFKDCTRVTSIYLHENICYFEPQCFYGCTGLETIEVDPNSWNFTVSGNCLITKEGRSVHEQFGEKCIVLACKTSVLPNTALVDRIGPHVFEDIVLENSDITLPHNLKQIGEYCFNRSNISSIQFEQLATTQVERCEFGEYCFGNCTQLTQLDLTNELGWCNLTANMFNGCSSLSSVTLPNQLESIAGTAFAGCPLSSVIFNMDHAELWSFSKTTALGETWNPTLKSVTDAGLKNAHFINNQLKGTAKTIYRVSKTDYIPLVFVDLGDDNVGIKANADTMPLETLNIYSNHYDGGTEKHITKIQTAGFKNISNLETVDMSMNNYITEIPANAFEGSMGIKTIRLNGSITSFGTHAFAECTRLADIDIPTEFTELPSYCFYKCFNLPDIDFSTLKLTNLNEYCLSQCTSIQKIAFDNKIERAITFGPHCFDGCYNAYLMDLSSSAITTISGDGAFYDCGDSENLTTVTIKIGPNVDGTTIGTDAFGMSTKSYDHAERIVYVDSPSVVQNATSESAVGRLFSCVKTRESVSTIYIKNNIDDPSGSFGQYIALQFKKVGSDVSGYNKWIKK